MNFRLEIHNLILVHTIELIDNYLVFRILYHSSLDFLLERLYLLKTLAVCMHLIVLILRLVGLLLLRDLDITLIRSIDL